MVIYETPVFTRRITDLMTDDEYRFLQQALILNPALGKVIPQSGGLRKVRWLLEGRGKSSGVRVIYYWFNASDEILMLFAYGKNEQANLTQKQLKLLRKVVEEELK